MDLDLQAADAAQKIINEFPKVMPESPMELFKLLKEAYKQGWRDRKISENEKK